MCFLKKKYLRISTRTFCVLMELNNLLPQSTPASSRNSSNSTYNATTNSIRLSLSTSEKEN